MKKLLKNIFHLNKRAYQEYKSQNLINPKTGLSENQRKRLLNYPEFKEGKADLFNKPFYFSHGPSLIHSIEELFEEDIYKFETDSSNPYIIDCGANIGLSVLYFKKLFPNAEILAFEPDDQIFAILEKNLPFIPNNENITIKKKAVWTEDTTLEFFSEGALAGSIVTDFGKKNNIIKVEAVDFKKFLNRNIDFLKIDIEGAENKLIFDIAQYLNNVENLFLEYHGIIGMEQNLGEILNLLKEKGFSYYIRLAGETIRNPYCNEKPTSFNQQLNIFCYRNKKNK